MICESTITDMLRRVGPRSRSGGQSYARLLLPFLLILVAACGGPAPDSEEQFILDAQALSADPCIRPTHVQPPLDGSFGDRSELAWRILEPGRLKFKDETQAAIDTRRAIIDGTRKLSDLPALWKTELEATRPDVLTIRQASHATSCLPPSRLRADQMMDPGIGIYSFITTNQFEKLAALQIRELSEAGKYELALDECGDALAVARDVSHAYVIGQMVARADVWLVLPACRAALVDAPPAVLSEFYRQLSIIEAGWAPIALTLEQEKVWSEVAMWTTLSRETQDAVPGSLRMQDRTLVDHLEGKGFVASIRLAFFGGWARRAQVRALNQMIAVATLSPLESDAQMLVAAQSTELAATFAWGATASAPSGGLARLIPRIRVGSALFKLLKLETQLRIFLAAHGHWPSSFVEAGITDVADPRTGRPFELRVDGPKATLVPPRVGTDYLELEPITLRAPDALVP